MRKIFCFFAACAVVFCAQGQTRTLNDSWAFKKGADGPWEQVTVPHTWNSEDAMDDTPGYYRGQGTYRRSLRLDSAAAAKRWYLKFDGVNQTARVMVNGKEAGSHIGGYTAFVVDITPFVNFGADNAIEVVADNSHNADIPPLSADFTFYGGIYRPVRLIGKKPVHISMLDYASDGLYVAPLSVDSQKAEIEVSLLLNNSLDRRQKVAYSYVVTAPDGQTIATIEGKQTLPAKAENFTVRKSIDIPNPLLWSPESPQLYSITAQVRDEKTGEAYDEVIDNFGLRFYSFDADKGFSLNGTPMKLIGANRHQDYGAKGWAVDDAQHRRDISLLKEMGANYIREAHYPHDRHVLDLCDRAGIMASVEIPIVNTVTPSDAFLSNSLRMQEEMIKQNFNHPSVIIWCYMNEVLLVPPYREGNEGYQPYLDEVRRQAQAIEDLTRKLDPARYTMIPFNNAQKIYDDARLHSVPMIVGWNIYAGWYGGDFGGLEEFLEEYRSKHPDKPTIISEYGADCDTRLHSASPKRFDYTMEYADLYHEHYLRAIKRLDYIAGGAVWVFNDFPSEGRENAMPHINLKGLVTAERTPKPTYWLYKANFFDGAPFVKIASSDWASRSALLDADGNAPIQMKVYSNRPEVELILNGQSLGRKETVDGFAAYRVPLTDGENCLEALCYSDGRKAAMDGAKISLKGVSPVLEDDFTELNVLLGSSRSYTDPATGVCWIPEKEYQPGGWGYVGGKPMTVRNWAGTLPASDISILRTDNDPLYQTQRVGLDGFRADVPEGKYAVTLIWADLTKAKYETLANNLGNDVIHEESDDTFSVSVNGQTIYPDLDIRRTVGRQTPLHVTVETNVTAPEGHIDIALGKPPHCRKHRQTEMTRARVIQKQAEETFGLFFRPHKMDNIDLNRKFAKEISLTLIERLIRSFVNN